MNPQVRAVILTDYVEIAGSLGLDPYAMLLEKQILPRHLRDPEWRLGAGPVLAAWISGSAIPLLFGWAMLAVAGGDLAAVWAIRDVPSQVLCLDHPERVGCRITEQPAA